MRRKHHGTCVIMLIMLVCVLHHVRGCCNSIHRLVFYTAPSAVVSLAFSRDRYHKLAHSHLGPHALPSTHPHFGHREFNGPGLTVLQDNKRQTSQFLYGTCNAVVAPLNINQGKHLLILTRHQAIFVSRPTSEVARQRTVRYRKRLLG